MAHQSSAVNSESMNFCYLQGIKTLSQAVKLHFTTLGEQVCSTSNVTVVSYRFMKFVWKLKVSLDEIENECSTFNIKLSSDTNSKKLLHYLNSVFTGDSRYLRCT